MFEFAPWSSSHRTRVRITKNAQYLPSLAIALNLLDSCYIPDSSKIRSNSIQNLKNRQNGKASGLQNRTIAKDLAVDFETDTADPTGLCASCRVTKPVRLDFLWRSCVRFCKILFERAGITVSFFVSNRKDELIRVYLWIQHSAGNGLLF